jgi:CRISPR-associated protein Cas2
MLVVMANDLPPAVRGRMKLWFIEPRANVFVSGVKDAVAAKVIRYLHDHCPRESGLIIFRRIPETPGYQIYGIGDTKRDLIEISGLQLVIEKQILSKPAGIPEMDSGKPFP